jgi:hypothetical protein
MNRIKIDKGSFYLSINSDYYVFLLSFFNRFDISLMHSKKRREQISKARREARDAFKGTKS